MQNMRRIKGVAVLLAAVLALGGCAQTSAPLPNAGPLAGADNVHVVSLDESGERVLFVISDRRKGPIWGVRDEWGDVTLLKNTPDVQMWEVYEISISPDQRYLAAVSVGEGHPVIDVFELEQLLNSRDSRNDVEIDAVASMNPYPGGVTIKGWESERVLVIESETDLDLPGRARGVTYHHAEPTRFHWDVEDDTFERVSDEPFEPVFFVVCEEHPERSDGQWCREFGSYEPAKQALDDHREQAGHSMNFIGRGDFSWCNDEAKKEARAVE